MTETTIARLYDTHDAGARAVRDLETAGIPHAAISIVSRDVAAATVVDAPPVMVADDEAAHAAGAGASVGTMLGGVAGLLAGIGALAIPGVGPVVAAGWLIATITGAGVGAAAGGIAGALIGAGVSADEANAYEHAVRSGGTLVTVRVDDTQAGRVESVLDDAHPSRRDRMAPAPVPPEPPGLIPDLSGAE